jgi:hypothetical protein
MPIQGEGPFITGTENRPLSNLSGAIRQSLDMSRPVDNRGGLVDFPEWEWSIFQR